MRPRIVTIDALRAVAVAAVVIVNAVGYAHLPDTLYVVPPPVPDDSTAAWLVHVALVALLQGKAYPLLAFLFGLGIALSLRARRGAPAGRESGLGHQRRRLGRLLVLGLVHGAVLYSGDVLTMYALLGFWLLRWSRLPARALVCRLRWTVAAAVLVAVLEAWALAALSQDPAAWGVELRGYAAVAGWGQHVALSTAGYLTALGGLPFVAPQVLALMTAGLLAGRLGILWRARWRPLLRSVARWALPVGLLLNVAIALAIMRPGDLPSGSPGPWAAGLLVAGPLLTAGFVAAWSLHPPRWSQALVGIGRRSLSVYLASSVVFAVVLGGAGLGLAREASSVSLAAIGLGTCAALLVLAFGLSRYRAAGALEAWLSR
jgi:uncharacterized protein